MLSKNFLQMQYNDWQQNLKTLDAELARPGGDRTIQTERIRKAKRWMAHYAEELRVNHGVSQPA